MWNVEIRMGSVKIGVNYSISHHACQLPMSHCKEKNTNCIFLPSKYLNWYKYSSSVTSSSHRIRSVNHNGADVPLGVIF